MPVKDKRNYGNTHDLLCCGEHYHVLCRGVRFCTRHNLLAILISLELMLNAVDINFVVFNRYLFPGQLEGFFFTLFAVAIAAAETAIAIAIIINIYRNIRNINVDNVDKMKY